MTVSPSEALPKDLVVFTISFTNSGNQSASRVWINDSMPGASFTYVSDTAASAGSTTPFPDFTFASVGIGPHSFQVTARVATGVAPGTGATNVASMAYTDASGAVQSVPSATATVVLGLITKQLHLTTLAGLTPTAPTGNLPTGIPLMRGTVPLNWDLSPPLALSFTMVNATAVLYLDSEGGSQATLAMNVTVWDSNGPSAAFVGSAVQSVTTDGVPGYQPFLFRVPPAANYTFVSTHVIRLSLLALSSGSTDDAVVAVNATTADSHLEVPTLTYVAVTSLSLRDSRGPATVWSPKDNLVVQATVSDPFGSYDIVDAKINITSPSGSLAVSYASMALQQTDGANPSRWKVYGFTLNGSLTNGVYLVEVVGIEGNGVVDVASTAAEVRAPFFTLQKTASVPQAQPLTRFTYTIWFNNTGTGPSGQVWINDTMPSQVSWRSSPNATVIPSTPIWTFTNVAVGAHWVSFDVRVSGTVGNVAFIVNTVSLNYSDEKGYLWPMEVATRDVILNGPVIALAVSSAPASLVHAKETVVYTISLVNTGDEAEWIWLNVTVPAGLTYVSDTHDRLWGTASVAGNMVNFTFANMPPGGGSAVVWTFTLTAQAGSVLARGSVLVLNLGLNDTSTTGILMPPRVVTLPLPVGTPWISTASLAFPSATTVPGDVLAIRVNDMNAGNEAAPTAWINVTLDPYLALIDASAPATFASGVLRITVTNLRTGPWTTYVNVSVGPTVPDRYTLTINGSLTYVDGNRNLLPSFPLAPVSASTAIPRFTLGVSPSSTTLEAGTPATLSVNLTNVGSGPAGDVWLNVSLPGSLQYVSDTSDGMLTVVGSLYMWHWQGFAPRTDPFDLNLLASPSATDRSSADLFFHVDATDGNGNLQVPVTVSVHAALLAPTIVLTLSHSLDQALPGQRISYLIQVRNQGSTSARYVEVSDPVDARLEIVSFNASVPVANSSQLRWNFTDLQPGEIENITLEVRVAEHTAANSLLANTVEARYSNSVGTPIGYTRSQPSILTVALDLMPILYILLAGAGVGSVLVFIVHRRNPARIEEVFLVYRDGILISHLSRTMVEDKDRDLLSGMLTAVQGFVKDSFQYGEHRELHQMEFGDYRMLIEQGKHVYLAVVYRGRDSPIIRKKVRDVLGLVEAAYGDVLANWDGTMDVVVGTRDILRDRLLVSRSPVLRSRPA